MGNCFGDTVKNHAVIPFSQVLHTNFKQRWGNRNCFFTCVSRSWSFEFFNHMIKQLLMSFVGGHFISRIAKASHWPQITIICCQFKIHQMVISEKFNILGININDVLFYLIQGEIGDFVMHIYWKLCWVCEKSVI